MPLARPLQSGVLLCALAFIMLLGYAIVRPSTESLLLEVYGADALPAAWVGVALVSAGAVALYNRQVARLPLGRVMHGAIAVSAITLILLLGLARAHVAGATFALYIWKDVHIVVLLEVLWSFANLVFESQTARWFNGVFCACGSLGGLTGNLLVGVLAQRVGTRAAPWAVLPLFAVQAVLVARLSLAAGQPAPREQQRIGWRDAAFLLQKSPYVGWLVLLVGTVQLAVNLLDYAYQGAIASAYPNTDVRTAVVGQIYAAIDVSAIVLQLGSGLIIRAIGVRATLLSVPVLLGAAVTAFVAAPRFALMAFAKVASKAFDYSLFRAAKEMLYLPLDYRDKTRGKALVDMLTYRVAKGGASGIILGLGALGAGMGVLFATLTTIVFWLLFTGIITHRHARLLARRERESPAASLP